MNTQQWLLVTVHLMQSETRREPVTRGLRSDANLLPPFTDCSNQCLLFLPYRPAQRKQRAQPSPSVHFNHGHEVISAYLGHLDANRVEQQPTVCLSAKDTIDNAEVSCWRAEGPTGHQERKRTLACLLGWWLVLTISKGRYRTKWIHYKIAR